MFFVNKLKAFKKQSFCVCGKIDKTCAAAAREIITLPVREFRVSVSETEGFFDRHNLVLKGRDAAIKALSLGRTVLSASCIGGLAYITAHLGEPIPPITQHATVAIGCFAFGSYIMPLAREHGTRSKPLSDTFPETYLALKGNLPKMFTQTLG